MESSYIVEINIVGAIEAGESLTVVPFTNSGVVEVEAELLDRGALLVPESFAVWGVEASHLLVSLETVRAENEEGVSQTVNKNVLSRFKSSCEVSEYFQCHYCQVQCKICYLVSVVFPQNCQGSSADKPATV